MREGVNFGCRRDNLPRANLPRKMQPLSQKQANDNWNFCRNLYKETKSPKRNLETFRAKCLFKYDYPVYLPFCFELYQTSFTLLKHRDLTAGFIFVTCVRQLGSASQNV